MPTSSMVPRGHGYRLRGANNRAFRGYGILSLMVLLVGNWKMAPEKALDALSLAKKTLALARQYKKITFVSCVPAIHLPSLSKQIKTTLHLGVQQVAASAEIAQTGLVSVGMAKSYGATYAIVGHSESRARGESDDMVRDIAVSLLQKKITPIVCVGERERDTHGWYLSTVKEQVEKVITAIPKAQLKSLVIAYEPIWAIGKNAAREATALECREMVIFIRKVIADAIGEKESQKVTILYGGSVNEINAASFITEGAAQGFLVGRVSLDSKRFGMLAKQIAPLAG